MIKWQFPVTPASTLIFLNGQRTALSNAHRKQWLNYHQIIVADGAWHDLYRRHEPAVLDALGVSDVLDMSDVLDLDISDVLDKITVMGDGDSLAQQATIHQTTTQQTTIQPPNFIHTPDQDATDFEKIVHHLLKQGISTADVYWGSGGEMDHFLGNLSVAAKYGHAIHLRFFDDKQCYFYLSQDCAINGGKGRTVTLYPFPKTLVSSRGLRYEMDHFLMKQYDKQSLRNQIISDNVELSLHGNAFLFISEKTNPHNL